jgi:hypothetical protein
VNTSLNFNGRGFINKINDLSTYAMDRNLDGFVVEGNAYLLKSSTYYQTYLKDTGVMDSKRQKSHAWQSAVLGAAQEMKPR